MTKYLLALSLFILSTNIYAATPVACVGTIVLPGSSALQIQAKVNASPIGATFCFSPGSYKFDRYVVLKEGTKFICPMRRTCIIDGGLKYKGALTGAYGTKKQLIQGFVVQNFISDGSWPIACLQVRALGVMQDNEVSGCLVGIDMYDGATARSNWLHHNARYGLSGGPGNDMLIESNEINNNNTARFDPNDNASGTKIIGGRTIGTDRLTWRNNYVHDNYGQGIWCDGNCKNVVYEGNVITDNTGAGIDHEISWSAVIRNNYVARNMSSEKGLNKSCYWGAQIAVNNSQDVEMYGNTIEADGTNAICLSSMYRNDAAAFPQAMGNSNIHDNIIRMKAGAHAGLVVDNPSTGRNIWLNNKYQTNPTTAAYWTQGGNKTFGQWKAIPQDAGATNVIW
ncbi:MAG: right-handed parallel beta-helix repeat-containing protein [Betaproteobacteria bacterium]